MERCPPEVGGIPPLGMIPLTQLAQVGAALAPHLSLAQSCRLEDQVVAGQAAPLAEGLVTRAAAHLQEAQVWQARSAEQPQDYRADLAARTHARDALRWANAARLLDT